MAEFVELKVENFSVLVKPFNDLTTEHILPLLNEPDPMRQFAMTQTLLRDYEAVPLGVVESSLKYQPSDT